MTYEKQLEHLIKLAKTPGWKSYAWHRAKELDSDRSGLFTGIAEDLKTVMQQQSLTKPERIGIYENRNAIQKVGRKYVPVAAQWYEIADAAIKAVLNFKP